MKSIKVLVIALALIFGLSIFSGTSVAQQANYLGEINLAIHVTERDYGPVDEKGYLTLGVTYNGGSYFTVQGYSDSKDDNPFVASGSGVLIGDELFMTLKTTQTHIHNNYHDAGTMQMRLSLPSLHGTFWYVSLDYDNENDRWDRCYGAGTASLVESK